MSVTQQVDDNVKIPAAVKAAGMKADQYYQQEAAEAGNTDGDQETKQEEAATGTTEENTEGRKEEAESGVTFESTPEAKSEDDQSWEHRYKSMKGRYDRASEQLRALSEQVASLQNVISTMQATSKAPASDEAEAAIERLITPEEENDYGPEFLKVVGKKAKEELLPIIKKYEAKIAQLEGQLEGVGGKIAQDLKAFLETRTERQKTP